MDDLYMDIEYARAAIAAHTGQIPRVGIILGSGLGELANELQDAVVIPYTEIPGFAAVTAVGHSGHMALGQLSGQPLMVMRGRPHFYEGYTMQQVTFPVRVMRAMGCDVLIVTNAAGGLRPDWSVGHLMCIKDQIFLPALAGFHPLRGVNDDRLGPRFPAMVGAFDAQLAELAHQVAAEHGATLHDGVYAMVSGPAYESSAELHMLRLLGADAVGMSTAPEVVVARHGNMRVLGISLITNQAVPDAPPANHEEVLQAGAAAKPAFSALLKGILARL